MDFTSALTMYFERGLALQAYWNFYITFSIGYLAFIGIATPSTRDFRLPLLLTIGFILFAVVNCNGLVDVARQRLALEALLRSDAKPLPFKNYPDFELRQIRDTFNAPPVWGVIAVHALGDLIMVAVIWISFQIKKDRGPRGDAALTA